MQIVDTLRSISVEKVGKKSRNQANMNQLFKNMQKEIESVKMLSTRSTHHLDVFKKHEFASLASFSKKLPTRDNRVIN